MYRFEIYTGDTGDLPTNENHINFKYTEANILFSATRRGNSAVFHFTCDKKGRRKLKQAINEFCYMCFDRLDWCEMMVGLVKKESIVRLGRKCGFLFIGKKDNVSIMMRLR